MNQIYDYNQKKFVDKFSSINPVKNVNSSDSISSLDTFASSAKSDDSLIEIWEQRRLSDEKKLKDNIPLRKDYKQQRMRDQSINNNTNTNSNTNSKSPSVKDALGILNDTKQIIENIGLVLDDESSNKKRYIIKNN